MRFKFGAYTADSIDTLHCNTQTLYRVCRWSEIVTHVPCGGSVLSPAGRFFISSTLEEIDGAGGDDGNILGFAGPTAIWTECPTISLTGNMAFDVFDIGRVEAAGNLEALILHEMGHVIGVG
ncbi:MAG: hypothetical protein ABJC87_18300 [Roseobacter sp.]